MKLTLVLRAVVLSATAFALAACAASPGGSSSSSFSFSSLSAATPPSAASHLYTQTNETSNKIIHYARNADGTLVEVERVATGGKGTNGYKILTRQKSAPDNLVSVGPVILSADNSMLFAVNASDSSVSSFSVGQDGKLHLRDRQPTGQKAPPTSLAYIAKAGMLYVMHSTGPNHIRSFKVADGKLRLMRKKYTLNTPRLQNRVGTQIISSPDERFLLANVVFNTPPPKVTPSNAKTKDGLLVFPIRDDGSLGKAVVNDAGGEGPFGLAFLNGSDNVFVNTLADSSGAVLSTLGPDGKVTSTPIARVALNPANKGPADTCWVSLSPDNRFAYATNFSFGNVTAFNIEGGKISVAADNQGYVPGDGNYKTGTGLVTSGPVDSWASRDGYFYQLYPNARQLVAYKMDGPQLRKVASYPVPYNSTVGLAGY